MRGRTWSTMGATWYFGDPMLLKNSHAFSACGTESRFSGMTATLAILFVCASLSQQRGWQGRNKVPENLLCSTKRIACLKSPVAVLVCIELQAKHDNAVFAGCDSQAPAALQTRLRLSTLPPATDIMDWPLALQMAGALHRE